MAWERGIDCKQPRRWWPAVRFGSSLPSWRVTVAVIGRLSYEMRIDLVEKVVERVLEGSSSHGVAGDIGFIFAGSDQGEAWRVNHLVARFPQSVLYLGHVPHARAMELMGRAHVLLKAGGTQDTVPAVYMETACTGTPPLP